MNKLKYEDVAKPGDRIRSYDFRGRDNCYVEGVVQRVSEENGYRAFVIEVDVDVWPQRDDRVKTNIATRVGQIVYVPMEIVCSDWDGRVVRLP